MTLRERLEALASEHPLYLDGDTRFAELALAAAKMALEDAAIQIGRMGMVGKNTPRDSWADNAGDICRALAAGLAE